MPMTLKQFMLRHEVLKLYRTFFRTIKQLPDQKQRQEVAEWVRHDFKSKKNVDLNEHEQIKSLLYQGQKMLNELKMSVDFSKA